MGNCMKQPGNGAATDQQHYRHECGDLEQGQPDLGGQFGGRCACGNHWQQHQRQNHRNILDNQPADRDATAIGVEQAALLHGAKEDDG